MRSLKIYDFAFVNIFVNKSKKHFVSLFTKFASVSIKAIFMRKLFIILTSVFFCISNIYAEEKKEKFPQMAIGKIQTIVIQVRLTAFGSRENTIEAMDRIVEGLK